MYKNRYTVTYRSQSPEAFIRSLLSKKSRKELSLEYLMELYAAQEGKCALSGVLMTHLTGNGRSPTNISIDKIDPTKGYVRGNVQLVCCAANQMKWDRPVADLLDWCNAIIAHHKH